MTNEEAWSWDETTAYVASKGYTDHYCLGSCGEAGLGSQHVFVRPDAIDKPMRDLRDYAVLSYADGRWCVCIHEGAPKKSHLRIVGGTDYE
jgi:hypothetical protein